MKPIDRFIFWFSVAGLVWVSATLLAAKAYAADHFVDANNMVKVEGLLHTVSYHTRDNDRLNNDNFGVGLLARKEDWLAAGGQLRNSQDRPSWYAMVGWQPEVIKDFRLGIGAGFATNYRTTTTTCTTQRVHCRNVTTCTESHKDRVRPAAALIASYQVGRVGINGMFAPPVSKGSSDSAGVAHLFVSYQIN